MNTFFKIATPVIAALALSSGAAFASPVVTIAPPDSGMAINDFRSEMLVFNPAEVTDLVAAKTLLVIKYDTAWSDGSDYGKAVNLLTDDSQSIAQLREAIKANAGATKLLANNHVMINDVVDIVSDGAGNVSLYVS